MTREELGLWLRLAAADGVGCLTATKLLQKFGLPEQIFAQSEQTLSALLKPAQVKALLQPGQELPTLIEATWSWLANTSGAWRTVVSLADSDYPRALLQLADPPVLLYATGSQAVYEHIAAKQTADDIAIVGSRNATPQGLAHARSFAKALAQSGLHIVSGLALGIDGAAHAGALDAQHDFGAAAGSTVAVVGTGLDRVYPKRHHDLAHRIVQHGVILSEFPIGMPPLAENFPRRNRIIAALSQGTLVVEAAIQSGSLITARQALDLGKDVFAIPGSIHSPQSKGCHHLIKQGAKLVESAQDVLDELSFKPSKGLENAMISVALNPDGSCGNTLKSLEKIDEDPFLQALGYEAISLDRLMERTGLPIAQLQVKLLELELLGDVARLPGGLFQRIAQA